MTSIKILVVEDNPADVYIYDVYFKEFKNKKIDVHYTTRLVDTLKLLFELEFDVILLDLSLPDSEGIETFKIIKRHKPELPVIILTGYPKEVFDSYPDSDHLPFYLIKGEFDSKKLESTIKKSIEIYNNKDD